MQSCPSCSTHLLRALAPFRACCASCVLLSVQCAAVWVSPNCCDTPLHSALQSAMQTAWMQVGHIDAHSDGERVHRSKHIPSAVCRHSCSVPLLERVCRVMTPHCTSHCPSRKRALSSTMPAWHPVVLITEYACAHRLVHLPRGVCRRARSVQRCPWPLGFQVQYN